MDKDKQISQRPSYAVIVDGSIDQTCETLEIAKKEKRDLKAMGFEAVDIRLVADLKGKLKAQYEREYA